MHNAKAAKHPGYEATMCIFDNLITKQIAVDMQSEDKDKGADHLAHGHEHHHALLCLCRTFGA